MIQKLMRMLKNELQITFGLHHQSSIHHDVIVIW
jgi:hypothetical protein